MLNVSAGRRLAVGFAATGNCCEARVSLSVLRIKNKEKALIGYAGLEVTEITQA